MEDNLSLLVVFASSIGLVGPVSFFSHKIVSVLNPLILSYREFNFHYWHLMSFLCLSYLLYSWMRLLIYIWIILKFLLRIKSSSSNLSINSTCLSYPSCTWVRMLIYISRPVSYKIDLSGNVIDLLLLIFLRS